MDEEEMKDELAWVKYRISILDKIEEKLIRMRNIVEKAKSENLSRDEIKRLNDELANLSSQVKALDEESRKIDDEKK